MRSPSRFSFIFSVILLLYSRVGAVLKNITIDDTFGDPETGRFIEYVPRSAWNDGRSCEACSARPSEDLLYRGTWTDSTFSGLRGSNDYPNTVLSASLRFNGTAVYVQCALARTKARPFGDSDMSFLIDGELVGTFVRDAPGLSGYDYNVTVFSAANLPAREHTLTIRNGHVNGTSTLILLDSVIYTVDGTKLDSSSSSATTSSTSSAHTTVIVAAVVGSITGIILSILAFLLYRRYRARSSASPTALAREISPLSFPASPRSFFPAPHTPSLSEHGSTAGHIGSQAATQVNPSQHRTPKGSLRSTNNSTLVQPTHSHATSVSETSLSRSYSTGRIYTEAQITSGIATHGSGLMESHECDASRPTLAIDTRLTGLSSLRGNHDPDAPPPAYEEGLDENMNRARLRDGKVRCVRR